MNKETQNVTESLLNVDLEAIVAAGHKKEAQQKKKKQCIAGITGVLCLVVVSALVYTKIVIPIKQYNMAVEQLEQRNYQQAIDGFAALGTYKDSADMVFESKYKWADSLLTDKSYDEAYAKFKEIQDYSDAADRMKDVRYAEAEECLESNRHGKAIELFEKLGDYKDSRTRVLEANYLWAEDYLKQGQLEGALKYFEKAGDYKDAKARADEVYEMMQIHATAVKLSKTSLTINKGKTAELTATLEPADTTDTIVSWTSSDEKVAKVDENGVVRAVGYGTAAIEVKTSNELIANCKIIVPSPQSDAKSSSPFPQSEPKSPSLNENDIKMKCQGTWKRQTNAKYDLYETVTFDGQNFSLVQDRGEGDNPYFTGPFYIWGTATFTENSVTIAETKMGRYRTDGSWYDNPVGTHTYPLEIGNGYIKIENRTYYKQ